MPRPEFILTDLSVKDEETGDWVLDVGDQDSIDIPFIAGEAITDVSAGIIDLRTHAELPDPPVEIQSQGAVVTVSGLTRSVYYELAVTFENSAGSIWTRTLVIHCVS